MHFQKKKLATCITALLSGNLLISVGSVHAETSAETLNVQTADNIEVVGDGLANVTEGGDGYAIEEMGTATKFKMSAMDTPQSVSVMTRARMDDFNLNTLTQVVQNTTGLLAERTETDRVYYSARGFDITNVQLDGVGLQNTESASIYKGDMDTVIYDHVEVVRGANGLAAGAGNPSATINLVRKRPTEEFMGSVSVAAGSWDKYRAEADVSGALTESGKVRGRLVTAVEDKNAYIDRYNQEKNVVYGVFDMDLSDNTVFTIGGSIEKSQTDSPMWGAQPLYLSDGTRTSFKRSSSTGADWSYYDLEQRQLFAELAHSFSNGWEAKAVALHTKQKLDSEMSFVDANPYYPAQGLPDNIGDFQLALAAFAFEEEKEQNNLDIYASGPFKAFGREHQAYVGGSYSKGISNAQFSGSANLNVFPPTGIVPLNDLDSMAGDLGENLDSGANDLGTADFKDRQLSSYGAVNLSLADPLNLILGTRINDWHTKGENYGKTHESKDSGVITPYAGITFDITQALMFYTSYTEIFNPQNKVDRSGNLLESVDGVAYEAGFKTSLMNDKLTASIAYFNIEQDNVAVEDIMVGGRQTYKSADGLNSKGFEFEIAGEVTDNLHTTLGYTYQDLDASDDAGDALSKYTPQQLVRFATVYRVPNLEKLKVGTSINWQDSISRTDTSFHGQEVKTEQGSYAIINLMASYEVTDNLVVQANANNVGDKVYYTSLKSKGTFAASGMYGDPANYQVSARYNF
ncbi:TonB-dependent siderophore receptor [Litoribacillus peritrichatus]|uniref:TonB-dependent siderophore receptor n=1 Tax=Litoribacillus peritrichatus TaxID=718191 RepID=A0ABP7MVD1_9GAMM